MTNNKIEYQKNKVLYHLDRLKQLGFTDYSSLLKPYLPPIKPTVLDKPYSFYIKIATIFGVKQFGFDDIKQACNAYSREVFNQIGIASSAKEVHENLLKNGFHEDEDKLIDIELGIYTKEFLDKM